MEKIVVCIMGQNCEKFIGMCFESVKDADAIVFCEGTDKEHKELKENIAEEERDKLWISPSNKLFFGKHKVIQNYYDQEDKAMNGKQRNFYLEYLKKNYPNHWALCIDADEVVADLDSIKKFIQEASLDYLYNLPMRHFIGDLGHEDSQAGPVLARLFKISNDLKYPEVEHPVLGRDLEKKNAQYVNTNLPPIWHLAYIPNLWDYKKKYLNHMKKSNMHSPEYLANWYYLHLFGRYPRKDIQAIDIPPVILKEFGFDPDLFYFKTHNQLEVRHFQMLKQWADRIKPTDILELGCGMGMYGAVAEYLGYSYRGMELSHFACKNNHVPNSVQQGDITEKQDFIGYSMVLVIDVLEHLEEEDLDKTLEYISTYGNNYIFSVPYLGDPNLNADPTHRIKQSKEWWVNKLSKYFKIEDVPKDWLFAHQLLIGKK